MEQIKGTMVLIIGIRSQKDKCEIDRLFADKIGFKFEHIKYEKMEVLIKGMTAIDGTVILDHEGTCYGMGVILDNLEDIKGKSERGARYNSAYKYIISCKRKGTDGMAIVVSADRTVDILTTLDAEEK